MVLDLIDDDLFETVGALLFAPSIVIVIGVMRPPIRRMPAMPAYAVPASALPPLRATESASCANVCAAAAADRASIEAISADRIIGGL